MALLASGYSHDEDVLDRTGVGILPGTDLSFFGADLRTPADKLCLEWSAWGSLLAAAPAVLAEHTPAPEPYTYDLVNTGREVLAQLSTPLSVNFSRAFKAGALDAALLNATGGVYIDLLLDIDSLLATDQAFLLGSWLARKPAAWHTVPTTATTPLSETCAATISWSGTRARSSPRGTQRPRTRPFQASKVRGT